LRPRRNARKRSAIASGDLGSSNPITGIGGCCARAASGNAAAPPSSDMNSRSSLDHLVGAGEQRG
jgi:hypothetical protein